MKAELSRGFSNIFSRMATGFHVWARRFELNFFTRKLSTACSNQVGRIVSQLVNLPGVLVMI